MSMAMTMTMVMINYKDYIESVPDFPIEGILYRDIQPLLEDSVEPQHE